VQKSSTTNSNGEKSPTANKKEDVPVVLFAWFSPVFVDLCV